MLIEIRKKEKNIYISFQPSQGNFEKLSRLTN